MASHTRTTKDPGATVTGLQQAADYSDALVGASVTVLTGDEAGRFHLVGREGAVLGRSAAADILFPLDTVSRHHARIAWADGQFTRTDLGSHNGTFLDGLEIHGSITLPRRCRIQLGTQLILQFDGLDLLGVQAMRKLSESLLVDALTGTGNRSHLEQRLLQELSYARRHRHPFGLLLLDLDHFKDLNDTHGHVAGDHVLAAVGQALREVCRAEDAVFRYGGEEFCVLVRGLDASQMVRMAERIRKSIAALRVETHNTAGAPVMASVTVSIGVASLDLDHPPSVEQVLLTADRALYRAKAWGRDRVEQVEPE